MKITRELKRAPDLKEKITIVLNKKDLSELVANRKIKGLLDPEQYNFIHITITVENSDIDSKEAK